jgi:chitin disaccharide deacetylase
MKGIIINADDFGLKSSVNSAIVKLFNNKLINSTTMMSNMPGFEEAIELAYNNKITDRIGIHLNLNENHLLSPDVCKISYLDNENHLDLRKERMTLFFISKNEKKLIYKEFEAQIEKYLKTGIKITHIDTHHHIHEIWPIAQIILTLLKNYKIPSMRITNNLDKKTKFYKSTYRNIINKYIRVQNSNFSDFFGNQFEVISLMRNHPSIIFQSRIETMVHPDYNVEGELINVIDGKEYLFEYPKDFSKLVSSHLYY